MQQLLVGQWLVETPACFVATNRGSMDMSIGDNISSAAVIFSDTGETYFLRTKLGSVCHFFAEFAVGKDIIQLRLDWSDLDDDGQLLLDADFLDPHTRMHRSLTGKRLGAHHTVASPRGSRCYKWEFDGFSRQFSVVVAWSASVAEIVQFSDSCFAEIKSVAGNKPIN